MKEKQIPLTVINPQAAGIDVGSRTHFVAIGQEQKDVKSFGVYAEDLTALTQWLIKNDITTVAMESTGAYWQNLFVELINKGLDVVTHQWKVYQKYQSKKNRCTRLSVDTKNALTGFAAFEFLARSYHRKTKNLL